MHTRLALTTWVTLHLTFCLVALLDDPQYVKALHRRAASNDALGTWSSLTSAEGGL